MSSSVTEQSDLQRKLFLCQYICSLYCKKYPLPNPGVSLDLRGSNESNCFSGQLQLPRNLFFSHNQPMKYGWRARGGGSSWWWPLSYGIPSQGHGPNKPTSLHVDDDGSVFLLLFLTRGTNVMADDNELYANMAEQGSETVETDSQDAVTEPSTLLQKLKGAIS